MDVTSQELSNLEARLNAKIDHILELLKVVVTMNDQGVVESNGIGNGVVIGKVTDPAADALDVRGHVNIAADPPRIYATPNQDSVAGQFLQLIDGKNRSSAFGLKAGGVLVSDKYNFANPAAGELVVQKKVHIGVIKDDKPVVEELKVEGNAAVSGEISEGGKKLAEKYQQAGNYYKKGASIAVETDSTNAKKIDPNVEKTTAEVRLEIVGEDKATKKEPIGARIRIGGNTSNVVTSGFRIDRASTTLLQVTHGGDLELPEGRSLMIGDVTITVEKVEVYERTIFLGEETSSSGGGKAGGITHNKLRTLSERKQFLTAPGGPWRATNEKKHALVLREKDQEPILISSNW